MTEPTKSLDERVFHLEEWRKLIVDPTLEEHSEKVKAFERIEQQITGAVTFIKWCGGVIAAVACVTEITRLFLALAHIAPY